MKGLAACPDCRGTGWRLTTARNPRWRCQRRIYVLPARPKTTNLVRKLIS